MAEQIKINDGSKTYEIVNESGKVVCELTINPTDMGMIPKLNDIIETLKAFDIDKDASDEQVRESIVELDGKLIKKVSDLFRHDVSETLFKTCSPMSILDSGNVYIVEVIEAITPVIEKVTKARAAKLEKRMSKYTAAYNK